MKTRESEKAQHTPGPWQLEGPKDATVSVDAGPICYLDKSEGQETVSANARLIAAAPELLEALIGLVDCVAHGKGKESDALDKAVSAIYKAKAEGR